MTYNYRSTHMHAQVADKRQQQYEALPLCSLLLDEFIQWINELMCTNTQVADKRQQQYEALGIVHFYLMSLSNELVLDATRAGSMGRFINHSAQPNCITEKW